MEQYQRENRDIIQKNKAKLVRTKCIYLDMHNAFITNYFLDPLLGDVQYGIAGAGGVSALWLKIRIQIRISFVDQVCVHIQGI